MQTFVSLMMRIISAIDKVWQNLSVLEMYEKLLSDPYVLFLVTAAIISTNQKFPHQFYAEHTKKHSYQVWFQLVM